MFYIYYFLFKQNSINRLFIQYLWEITKGLAKYIKTNKMKITYCDLSTALQKILTLIEYEYFLLSTSQHYITLVVPLPKLHLKSVTQ